ncbi:hypothetical protein QMO14_32595, partial [Variovorax sp. CAN2819]|uniref:hypothetical protein n=1 Tax=Variovorax sp. CAN15 TaxID=3046727 RepID=UPI00264A0631
MSNFQSMLALRLSSFFAPVLLALGGCAASLPSIPMDKARWSEPIKAQGVSARLYQTNELQVSSIGGHSKMGLIYILVGETKAPAVRPKTAALLADDVARELGLASDPSFDAQAATLAPWESFEKPITRRDAERRFVLKVGVRGEALNHMPTAWATN